MCFVIMKVPMVLGLFVRDLIFNAILLIILFGSGMMMGVYVRVLVTLFLVSNSIYFALHGWLLQQVYCGGRFDVDLMYWLFGS
jgi:hypothetical protein